MLVYIDQWITLQRRAISEGMVQYDRQPDSGYLQLHS